MIPSSEPETGNLPPGIHEASWDEFVERYGYNAYRRRILDGLRTVILHFRKAGCQRIYVNGSFVTDKERPGDYDACWDEETTDDSLLDPIFQNFERTEQKRRYKGELFPSLAIASLEGLTYLRYFQRDRQLNPKGIILINTGDVPT